MAPRERFPAGLALPAHKPLEAAGRIVDCPAPPRLLLALDQGTGSVLEPVVAIGDAVRVGSVLARPRDPYGTALHAPCSGHVSALGIRDAATETRTCLSLEVQNDGLDACDPAVRPIDAFTLEPAELVARLREAGIAGLGGAGFPTATKLEAARTRAARRLLLNGAECEPWICCDDALMSREADDVVLGARVLMRALEAPCCTIALEDDKPAALEALRGALGQAAEFTLEVVPAVYPRGAERQLITAVAGIEVPSRGLPAEVGWTCQNVSTAAAVGRWARTGEPCIARVVTVTGSGVARPANVRARLGTPLAALVAAAGGYRGEPLRLIAGGNMTGRALPSDEVGLAKSINCVLVATRADLEARPDAFELPCIRCGDCAQVCPPGLLPQQIHRAVVAGADAAAVELGVWDCIDCGCCDYVCPSQIPLALRFRGARARLREAESSVERARTARVRFERHERRRAAAALAEQQAFDDAREQARRASDPDARP